MKRIYGNLKAGRGLIIWLVAMAVAFSLKAIVEHKLENLPSLLVVMLCVIFILQILNQYFSYLILYPDGSFRKVDWFYRMSRVRPADIIAIGFVPRALDKVYQDIYVKFKKNGVGRSREFQLGVKAYSQYTIASLLNHIVENNENVKLDDYCEGLLKDYRSHPGKLEKSWQHKFNMRSSLPQWLTDILMFMLLLLCIFTFLFFTL